MDGSLATLIERRRQLYQDRACAQQKAEAVLLLAREQGREMLEPEEDTEFRKHVDDMRATGPEIWALNQRIEAAEQA
jgi:transposase